MIRDVTFVIVTHNHAEYIEECLRSCTQSLEFVDGEIIVVDNCSTDGTIELINKFENQVTIIHNTVRTGFSANNNQAIRRAQGEYVFILNPDTSFDPHVVKDLIESAKTIKNLGLLAPQLVYPNGNIQPSCRRFPTLGSFLVRRTPLRLFYKHSKLNEKHLMYDHTKDGEFKADWVLGACMLVPMDVFDRIGLFDERYFLYVEDIDLCYRIHQANMDVVYTSRHQIVHRHLAESDHKLLGKKSLHHFKSMIRFVLKYKLHYNYLGL